MPRRAHQWHKWGNGRLCAVCRQRSASDHALKRREKEQCPGFCAHHHELLANPRGHKPMFLGYIDDRPSNIIMCWKRGSFSEGTRGLR
eukprot:9123078-Pyramimonas_sp.AAC.1